jgi:hypothetical protein
MPRSHSLATLTALRLLATISLILTLLTLTTAAQAIYTTKKMGDGSTAYLDRDFKVSFRLPPRCAPFKSLRWWDRGWEGEGKPERATTVSIRDWRTYTLISLYYRLFNKPTPLTPEETDHVLMADVDSKVSQRKDKDGLKDYRVRSNSYESRDIAGQRALLCVADYKQGKTSMVEYLVWIRNDKSIAQFFIRVPAEQFDQVRQDVEPIIQSLRLP